MRRKNRLHSILIASSVALVLLFIAVIRLYPVWKYSTDPIKRVEIVTWHEIAVYERTRDAAPLQAWLFAQEGESNTVAMSITADWGMQNPSAFSDFLDATSEAEGGVLVGELGFFLVGSGKGVAFRAAFAKPHRRSQKLTTLLNFLPTPTPAPKPIR